jgi:hypothetical protein
VKTKRYAKKVLVWNTANPLMIPYRISTFWKILRKEKGCEHEKHNYYGEQCTFAEYLYNHAQLKIPRPQGVGF